MKRKNASYEKQREEISQGGGYANKAKPYDKIEMKVLLLSPADAVRASITKMNDIGEDDPFVSQNKAWRKW